VSNGIFRYVLHHDVADRLNEGWRWCGIRVDRPMVGADVVLLWRLR
jgi:hypothetical protein